MELMAISANLYWYQVRLDGNIDLPLKLFVTKKTEL